MSRPLINAFLGGLWDVHLTASARRVTVELALPMSDLDRVLRGVGLPPPLELREDGWQAGALPALMILPARVPRHPENESDVLALSAVAYLGFGLETGAVRLTPALSKAFDRLREKIDGLPVTVPLPAPEAS